MAWYNYNNNNSGDSEKDLAYDLRQKYAEIVGKILQELYLAKRDKDFPLVYELLDDHLHSEIHHKLTSEERKEYEVLLKRCKKILNDNSSAFLKKSNDPISIQNVKSCLKELELWLKSMMEEHNMFGSKEWDEEGL